MTPQDRIAKNVERIINEEDVKEEHWDEFKKSLALAIADFIMSAKPKEVEKLFDPHQLFDPFLIKAEYRRGFNSALTEWTERMGKEQK